MTGTMAHHYSPPAADIPSTQLESNLMSEGSFSGVLAMKEQEFKFLTKEQVCELTTLSKAEIDRREAQGRFPRRRRLSHHPRGRVVWLYHEIVEWMSSFLPLTVQPVSGDFAESGADD